MTIEELNEIFTRNYDNYIINLIKYSAGWLKKQDATEIVNDTYIKLRKLLEQGKLDHVKKPTEYFGQTSYRIYFDLLRKKKSDQKNESKFLSELKLEDEVLDEEINYNNLIFKTIDYLSNTLSERQFTIFIHTFIYDSTQKEIQKTLKIPRDVLKSELKNIKIIMNNSEIIEKIKTEIYG